MTARAAQLSPTLLRVSDIDGDALVVREGRAHQLYLWLEPENADQHLALIFEPDKVRELSDFLNAWLEGGKTP